MRDIIELAFKDIDESRIPFDKEPVIDIFAQRLAEIDPPIAREGDTVSVRLYVHDSTNRYLAMTVTPIAERGCQLTVYLTFPYPGEEIDIEDPFIDLFGDLAPVNTGSWVLHKNHNGLKDPSFTHQSYWELFEKLLCRIDRGVAPESLVKMFSPLKNMETSAGRFEIRPDDTNDGFIASYDLLVMLRSSDYAPMDRTYLGLRFDYLN